MADPAMANPAAPVCALCGAPRRPVPFGAPRLCGALRCAHRHAAMPADHRCRVCTTPLVVTQWASGVCADQRCRDEWLAHRPRRLEQARTARRLASAHARRDRAAAARGVPRDERASWRVALLPHNPARPSRQSAERADALEAHLRTRLAEARSLPVTGEAQLSAPATADTGEPVSPQAEAEQALLGAACASCRGECCRGGHNHAWITADTMRDYLRRHPAHDDDTIVARYRAQVPARSLTGSCLYHTDTGCQLPRDLRSEICNEFFCSGIDMLRGQYAEGDPLRAYLLHRDGDVLKGGQFVQIAVRRG